MNKNMLAYFAGLMALGGGMFDELLPRYLRRREELNGLDLNKEYELIKQKKSSLPAQVRAEVVYIVEKHREETIAIKQNKCA